MKLKTIRLSQESVLIEPEPTSGAGGLDLLWVPLLEKEFHEVMGSPVSTVILDLKSMNYIDSSTLRILVNWTMNFAECDRQLCLTNVNSHIQRILRLTSFDSKVNLVNAPVFAPADDS